MFLEPVNQAVCSNTSHGLNSASAGSQQQWTKLYSSKTMNNKITIFLAPDHTPTHLLTELLSDWPTDHMTEWLISQAESCLRSYQFCSYSIKSGHHLSLTCTTSTHPTLLQLNYLWSILILFSQLYACLKVLFLSDFAIKFLYTLPPYVPHVSPFLSSTIYYHNNTWQRGASHKSLHYAVFFSLLSLPPSQAQIFSSVPCSWTPST